MEKVVSFIKEIIGYVLVIIIIIVIKKYVVSPIRVNQTSMYPTLHDKDIMLLNKISYHFKDIERFDIVVFEYEDEYLIKRVIGLPGENIEYKGNILYVNGKKVEEDFTKERISDFQIEELGTSKVPKDSYFVVGDNRINSKDSRRIGFISKEQIVGKSHFTILPFDRFGTKK